MTRGKITCSRVYVWSPTTSPAFLVDRLWPRGIRRDTLKDVAWLKDVAPSDELRKWYGHDPARWAEFRDRYRHELDAHRQAAEPILTAAKKGDVTLLYGARDEERNNAVVLRDWLLHRLQR